MTLANFRTAAEAETAGGLLEQSKIPYLIQSMEGAGMIGLQGGANLLVRPDQWELAREVLDLDAEDPDTGD